jgi:DNA-binding CsgD family transcriptional regulator
VWGGFVFRAYWLEAADSGSALIGITVTHQEPVPIRIMRSIRRWSLSPRQSEVCLMLATGSSYEEVARKLKISRHTAVAHGRWIYDRADVRSRAELVGKLLSG